MTPDEPIIRSLEPGSAGVPLGALGWSDAWEAELGGMAQAGFVPARVTRVDRGMPVVASVQRVERAEPAAHLIKTGGGSDSRAVVGDWVALSRPEGHDLAIIEAILPRVSAFTRKDPADDVAEQVLIANADVVFVMQSLSGRGVNLRRLERELVLAYESGATPVVVLSKSDLCGDCVTARAQVEAVSPGVDVVVESAITGDGLEDVRDRVGPGVTAALLGESGVGKSTLVNRLIESDVMETGATRERDDKGRHTTVAREMLLLPGGGIIIDTPGMRALALWDADRGIAAAFSDVEQYAASCRFADCAHEGEPGCAVAAAVESGELPAHRLESYRDLKRELAALAVRQDEKAWRERERANKAGDRAYQRFQKRNPKHQGRS